MEYLIHVFAPFMRSLAHVFRNAVAHGIEDYETRLKLGKAPQGRIVCEVRRSGPAVQLSISDDGAGIDERAVRARVAGTGLMPADCVARLTADEALDLIFLDTVTTSEQVNHFSGRGVGLAAVRADVQRLGGTVTVASRPGHGTTFSFSLPLDA